MSNLPHVTQILKDAGLVDCSWFTDYMRQRGTALHLACELYDKDDLDLSTLDPEIEAPFRGYLKFLEEVDPEILGIEKHVTYPGIYQGTLDRRVIMGVLAREGILDLKGQPSPVDRLQLAGYAMTFPRPMRRWNLYLRVKEGDYKLVEHRDRQIDDKDFMACVRIAAFRRAHGMVE